MRRIARAFSVESFEKTSDATAFLARFGLDEDVEKCRVSKKLRRGKGKMRDRRYVMRRGPLIVHADGNCAKAFRNLPGVELCHVDRMNLLQLAPGGHVGRLRERGRGHRRRPAARGLPLRDGRRRF